MSGLLGRRNIGEREREREKGQRSSHLLYRQRTFLEGEKMLGSLNLGIFFPCLLLPVGVGVCRREGRGEWGLVEQITEDRLENTQVIWSVASATRT